MADAHCPGFLSREERTGVIHEALICITPAKDIGRHRIARQFGGHRQPEYLPPHDVIEMTDTKH